MYRGIGAQVRLILGDCLEVMAGMDADSIDAVVTDPPYGCGKADWDDAFPSAWYAEAKRVSNGPVVIITGSVGLADTVPLVGDDYLDCIAARNLNSLTRSAIGFSNWLAAVVACHKPRQGVTFFEFAVRGEMPDHPSPKPIEYMRKLITRVTEPGDVVLDPFTGSGTTGVACAMEGRDFIGIEIDPEYFKIAKARIESAAAQMRMEI